MGGTGGRPKGNSEAGTRQVRIFEDLAEKISYLVKLGLYETTAQMIDPLVRPAVESLSEKFREQINRIKQAEAEVKKALERGAEEVQGQPPKKKPRKGKPPRE